MRILHVINVRWLNATAWYAYRLAEAATAAGDEAAIAGEINSPVVNAAKDAGITTFESNFNSNNIFKIAKTISAVNKFIEEWKPDMIVCHRGEMFWYFALYRKFFFTDWRFVRVRGDVRPPTKDFLSRFMHNKCADKIVVSADFIREQFLEKLKTQPEHVKTIYGGVNTAVFKPDAEARKIKRTEFGFSHNDYVVSVVGRFDPVKGHEVFLKACGILYKNGMKNIRPFLVGFPENVSIADIERMIAENGLKDVAVMTGRRSDIPDIMNASDLGVISSLGSEAICRVAMEFMACGTKVVASTAGVLPEMLPESDIYSMHNAEELAERIKSHSPYKKIYDQNDFYKDFKKWCTSF